MRTLLLILLLSLFSDLVICQNAGTIKVQKPVVKKDSVHRRFFEVEAELKLMKYAFLNLDVHNMYMAGKLMINPEKRVGGLGFQLRYPFQLNQSLQANAYFGPEIFFDQSKNNVALTPEIKFAYRRFPVLIGYGYNFILGKQEIAALNTHFITVTIKFWSGKVEHLYLTSHS